MCLACPVVQCVTRRSAHKLGGFFIWFYRLAVTICDLLVWHFRVREINENDEVRILLLIKYFNTMSVII